MAYYNPGYPYYQPQPMAQPMQQPMMGQPTGQVETDRTFVMGEAGADSYIVARGTSKTLWDAKAPMIYIKTVDWSGLPTVEKIPIMRTEAEKPKTDFVTRAEFEALVAEVRGVKEADEHVD